MTSDKSLDNPAGYGGCVHMYRAQSTVVVYTCTELSQRWLCTNVQRLSEAADYLMRKKEPIVLFELFATPRKYVAFSHFAYKVKAS